MYNILIGFDVAKVCKFFESTKYLKNNLSKFKFN